MGSFITPIIVGRHQELSQLDYAVAAVQDGAGRCVLVSGEAGIGKNRLLAEIRDRAADRGFFTLTGRCFEQDRSFPYAPLIDMLHSFLTRKAVADKFDALGPLATELVKLLPDLARYQSVAPHLSVSQSTRPLEPEIEKRRLF